MTIVETDKQQIEKIVQAFSRELVQQLHDEIYEVIWYGSTARGDSEEGSDIDVAIISQQDEFAAVQPIWKIANKISLEYDAVIDPRVISHSRFYGEWGRLSYLAEDINNEGILIWKRNSALTLKN